MTRLAQLPARTVIEVSGEDRVAFLQGLVSNDVTDAAPGRAVWAALLTPQGKYVADFFILSDGERLLLDVEAAQAAMLIQRLSRYRLRSRVAIATAPLLVYAAWDGAPEAAHAIMAPDPRLEAAGWRVLAPEALAGNATEEEYDLHRLALGLPDGSRDMEADKTVLLEAGFDELNGVSWSKGCYMGQELTARTKYRGLLKRRLVPVTVAGALPPPGTPITRDGAEVGTMRSGREGLGIALLRLEALEAGRSHMTKTPSWPGSSRPSTSSFGPGEDVDTRPSPGMTPMGWAEHSTQGEQKKAICDSPALEGTLAAGEAVLTPRVPAWMRSAEPVRT